MIEAIDPKATERPLMRCSECDREVTHYNQWFNPDNSSRAICWRCVARAEKGFNAKPDFRRGSRFGFIPR
ncbi:MAG: hypothetical protein ABI539_15500 [Acidobacteriota bacterium]